MADGGWRAPPPGPGDGTTAWSRGVWFQRAVLVLFVAQALIAIPVFLVFVLGAARAIAPPETLAALRVPSRSALG